ncbi:cAMP-regulated phosphoprotein 19 [Octodon degus]|uniref:cAMP-regulated phosphoprotein 19 n=1 Tax=Octodon degus TaxID=10160 RepID=A0A6P3VD18_OCTDE|nr:cAMP-regulated phosphoprotein 19 [Octodon degus]
MSAEVPEAASAEEQKEMEDKVTSPEKAEEAKLKARYPHLGQKPGGSDFLRKRLQKGQKYFDSGDYNMAKAKMKNKQLPTATPDKTEVTGDHIPTPQDLPQRKPSLVTSKLAGPPPGAGADAERVKGFGWVQPGGRQGKGGLRLWGPGSRGENRVSPQARAPSEPGAAGTAG